MAGIAGTAKTAGNSLWSYLPGYGYGYGSAADFTDKIRKATGLKQVDSLFSSLPGYTKISGMVGRIGRSEVAIPMAAVALTTYFIFCKINENIRLSAERLKHQQTAEAYHRRFNASLIGVGVLAFALKALEAASAFAIALSGASIGCGVFAAVVLSNWVYQRSLAHAGSRAIS